MWKRSGYDSGKGGGAGEGKGGGKGSKKGGGGGAAAAPGQCVMKFLAPEVLASAIIGKGGAVIAEMRKTCQAQLALTDHGPEGFYPQTESRVLTAKADEQESLTELSRQLVAKLVELAKGSAADVVGSESELKLKALVPKAAVGGIIGKGGESIKQLRETSGAKISFSEATGPGPGAEQTVSLVGTADALEAVLKEVNTQIQLLNGESWFTTWASTSATGGDGSAYWNMPPTMPYGGGRQPQGVDIMMKVAYNLPPYVMEDSRGFALSCVVPDRLVGGLIGRGGQGTKQVQIETGTKISIREIPGDKENRSMNIAGPLANTCAAYMLMMKRYLDAEAASAAAGPAA